MAWESLNVRDGVVEKAEKLAKLMTKATGETVRRPDAVEAAIDREIKRIEAQLKRRRKRG